MQLTVTVTYHGLCVPCWAHGWAVQKRVNW